MKLELVKCHEVVEGKKTFVGEGNLKIAESLEDIIAMQEPTGEHAGECSEADIVTLFNASRRIRFQARLKAGNSDKPSPKVTLAKLEALALTNPELAKLLAAVNIVPNVKS